MHIAGERCLRAGPKNGTNGFFIAVFIRKGMHTGSITLPQIPESASTCVWKSDEGNEQKSEKKRKRKRKHKKGRKRTLPVTAC